MITSRHFLLLLPALLLFAGQPCLDAQSTAQDPAFIRKAAYQIDSYVADWYRQQNLKVPEVTDDATFLRRTFLVTIGRIPTAEEAREFLEMNEENKRPQLIHYLLESPGYSSHMSNWAFDLLRVVDRKRGFQGTFEPYRQWVREAIDQNMPWDEFTRAILAAEGSAWNPETAAVGYYLRDRGMPLDNLSNSMRIFLGARMECAQCHDDPFGVTERKEFYELAAFVNGQRQGDRRPMRELWREVRQEDNRRSLEFAAARVIWNGVYGMYLQGGGSGVIKLPDDYQYRDGKPGERIGARTPFGTTVRMSERRKHDDGREELAEWVTTKNEERFPSVIANRMWERIMGRAFYDPVDEFTPATDTHIPAMMSYLVKLMVDVDYDLKTFQKVLLNTKTFQFVPNPQPSKVDSGDDLHGRQLTRMSAEQLWDSLITLASGNPDNKPRRQADYNIRVRGKPVMVGKKNMLQLTEEVLELDSPRKVERYFDQFLADVKKELGNGGSKSNSMMMMEDRPRKYGKNAQVRASELPSPAPRDHLLFVFGQSDREVVENASREPNVGQVLALMNGFVQDQLVNNPDSHIYRSLEGAETYQERIRRLYIAILNRPPSDQEMKWMLDEVNLSGESSLRNIVAALVMSSEFLYIQ